MMDITSILIEVIGLLALCIVFVTITMVLLKKSFHEARVIIPIHLVISMIYS